MDKQKREQAQKLELLGQMSGALLHDIKTPISYLKSNNKYIQKKISSLLAVSDSEKSKILTELLTVLKESDEGLIHLSDLTVQHSDFLSNTSKKTVCSLHSIIKNSCNIAKIITLPKAQQILTLSAGNDSVVANTSRLNQVIINLIVNAAEAFTAKPSDNCIQIHTYNEKGKLILSIKDNACGISENKIKSIFDWYVTDKKGGTGQGLAICREILLDHNAQIECRSILGCGSEFILTFSTEGL